METVSHPVCGSWCDAGDGRAHRCAELLPEGQVHLRQDAVQRPVPGHAVESGDGCALFRLVRQGTLRLVLRAQKHHDVLVAVLGVCQHHLTGSIAVVIPAAIT